MARYLGTGAGTGTLNLSTYTIIKSSCSGTSGTTSLTATGAFVAGQRLFIDQSMGGSNVGKYEDNRVASYTTGTITLVHPLENTYTDSGSEQAQVTVVPEAGTSTGTLTVPAWDGDVGGRFITALSGVADGTINGEGRGFRGGLGLNSGGATGAGGGTAGPRKVSGDAANPTRAANGTGGGSSNGESCTGASGGHATAGNNGVVYITGGAGVAGEAFGSADMSLVIVMGGGAAGASGNNSLSGGAGGAVVVIYAKTLAATLNVTVKGANGSNETSSGAGASGGAGGSILVKCVKNLGATLTASKGSGGTGTVGNGVAGADGRIRIETCSNTVGTEDPTASVQAGGYSYCGGSAFLL